MNSTSQNAQLSYAGQKIEVRDTVSTTFENEYQKVKISLAKYMEKDNFFGVGNNGEYKKVRFGLFAYESLTASNGKNIPKDSLIEEISLGKDLTAEFQAQIPFGKYYVQEIATDEHYVLNGEKHLVNFSYQGQKIQTVNIDCGTFKNVLKRGSVRCIKVNENDQPLENALFGLFAKATTEYNVGNAIMTAVSDKNGCFSFENIPYGEYVIREISAPNGYVFSDKLYPVSITDNEQVVKIKAVNKPITVSVSKVDVYGNELKGATLHLMSSDGTIVDSWVSDGTNHVVSRLSAGNYTLREISAPVGYCIATDIRFSVDIYGKVTTDKTSTVTESANGNSMIVMVDKATQVEISKTDISGEKDISGAVMQVLDGDGILIDEWISDGNCHKVYGLLIAGKEYTLHEVSAPQGYELAKDISFTVSSDGSVDKVVMKDEETPNTPDKPKTPKTPKTPDIPHTGMSTEAFSIFYLAGSAALIICGISLNILKSKRKESEDNFDENKK